MKKIWIGLLKMGGWKISIPDKGERPEIAHCVLIMAPHTSWADYFVGASVLVGAGTTPRIFVKSDYFNWFTRPLLKRLGLVPVDRGNRKNNLVQQAIDELKAHDDILVVITPEGTRKPVKRFKRGFYDIAMGAGVPIVLGHIDYKKKEAGYGPTLVPTGDYDADFEKIIEYFRPIHAKHPEGWYWNVNDNDNLNDNLNVNLNVNDNKN